jgi:hypothetical protein
MLDGDGPTTEVEHFLECIAIASQGFSEDFLDTINLGSNNKEKISTNDLICFEQSRNEVINAHLAAIFFVLKLNSELHTSKINEIETNIKNILIENDKRILLTVRLLENTEINGRVIKKGAYLHSRNLEQYDMSKKFLDLNMAEFVQDHPTVEKKIDEYTTLMEENKKEDNVNFFNYISIKLLNNFLGDQNVNKIMSVNPLTKENEINLFTCQVVVDVFSLSVSKTCQLLIEDFKLK